MMRALRNKLAFIALGLFDRLDRPATQNRRGMAIVVVMATIAVLATSIVEFVYNTRVNLYLAQNHRDEVKAYFLARSGINLTRLSLAYQYELENQGGFIGQAIERSNFQLWQYLPLLLPTFSTATLSAGDYGAIDLGDTGASGFGGLYGNIVFHDPDPEEGKLNLNEFASRTIDQTTLQEFCSLLRPPQYDDLFGISAAEAAEERFEVIAAIIDHVDPDSDLTIIDEHCIASVGGVGNETSRYRDVDWEAKNEPFITLDEVRMVPGVTEAFVNQFLQNMTVYPVAGEFYVNLADAQGFAGLLCGHVQGMQEDVASPCVLPQIAAQVNFLALALEGWNTFFSNPFNVLAMYMGMGSMDPDMVLGAVANGQMIAFRVTRDFTNLLNYFTEEPELAMQFAMMADPQRALLFGYYGSMGQGFVPPEILVPFDTGAIERRISVRVPRIFTVTASGEYGAASRTITAVADYRDEEKLLYWREF